MVRQRRPLGTFYSSYRFLTVISRTIKPLSTFSQTYVLLIFNRNKVKATGKLSAPIRKNGFEYEEGFQVERKRRFLAVIFVILLSRITIKNLPTLTCLLDYCRMHKHQTHQISHNTALAERAQQKVWGVTSCPWNGGQYCVELQHGTFLGVVLLPTITEMHRKPKSWTVQFDKELESGQTASFPRNIAGCSS